jgi:hypothetical protein
VPQFGGAPGPEVDRDDLKAVWQVYREIGKKHSGGGGGLAALLL